MRWFGDNGIISNAQNANIKSSVAALEEFFHEYYVENYEEFDDSLSNIEVIRNKNMDWFFYTQDGYIVDESGHAMYLIVKANLLRDYPELNLKGGDAGDGVSYKYYSSLYDVYGITKDLKVYYCSNGVESIIGCDENQLDIEDYSRVVIAESNPLSDLIPHSGEDGLTIQDLRSVDELTIDESCNLKNLDDIYRLSSLKSLTIKSKKDNDISIAGLKNAYKLQYLCLYDCDLNDYSALSGLTMLKYLYLYKSTDSEVSKVFDAMKSTDYLELNYVGVFGVLLDIKYNSWYISDNTIKSNVTNINNLDLLTDRTKENVKYMLLHNNRLTSVEVLSGFKNINVLTLQRNELTSLSGLDELTSITTLALQSNVNLSDISAIKKCTISGIDLNNTAIENLNYLKASSGKTLRLQNISTLRDINQISTFSSCSELYLDGCNNLDINSVKAIRYVWNNIDIQKRSINNAFLPYLEVEDTKNYSGKGYDDETLSNLITNKTEILRLNIGNNILLGNTDYASLTPEIQNKIKERLGDNENTKTKDTYLRYCLSTLTGMKYLSLNGLKNLSNIDFVKYMPNIVELDLRGTSIVDLSVLDELKKGDGSNKLSSLGFIAIDNENVDFTTFQTTINSLKGKGGAYWAKFGDRNYGGLGIGNANCFSKVDKGLNYCTAVETLSLKLMGPTTNTYFDLSGMTNLKNYYAYTVASVIKLPSNVKNVHGEHMNHPFLATSESSPAQLVSYNNKNSCEDTPDAFRKLLDSLKYCQTTSEISFNCQFIYGGEDLTGIGNLKNLKISSFTFYPWYYNLSDLDALSELNDGNGYIKSFVINGSSRDSNTGNIVETLPDISKAKIYNLSINNFDIKNIDGLKFNKSITSLNLSGNSIQNLTALQHMNQLEKLYLSNNKIYNNCIDTDTNQKVNNLEILYQLNNLINSSNSLIYVDMRNNYLEENNDYDKVKNSFGKDCLW